MVYDTLSMLNMPADFLRDPMAGDHGGLGCQLEICSK